jgi:hypothetical protein
MLPFPNPPPRNYGRQEWGQTKEIFLVTDPEGGLLFCLLFKGQRLPMLLRLALNSWALAILWSQPGEYLGLQIHTTAPGQKKV